MPLEQINNKYEIQIAKVENGFIVRAGCKVFVFSNQDELLNELKAYLSGEMTKLTEKYLKPGNMPNAAETCIGGLPGSGY